MKISSHKKRKGFALIAVMWVVAFLSMILTVTLFLVKVEAELVTSDEHTFRAWQLAHTGFSYAVHPDVERGDEVLTHEPTDIDEGYYVTVKPAASKINLNYVIKVGDKPLLRNLLNHWLQDDDKATQLADALVDWVDADDLESLNGAEKEWYQSRGFKNRPFNRSFQTLDEIRLVKGFNDVEDAAPEWRSWLTLNSEGGIDIHEAEPEILSVAAETEQSDAEQFVKEIKGVDEILGTTDDRRYASVTLALDALASQSVNRELIAKRFILQGQTLRVESVGRSGVYRKKIQAIIRKRGEVPQVMYYKETILESE